MILVASSCRIKAAVTTNRFDFKSKFYALACFELVSFQYSRVQLRRRTVNRSKSFAINTFLEQLDTLHKTLSCRCWFRDKFKARKQQLFAIGLHFTFRKRTLLKFYFGASLCSGDLARALTRHVCEREETTGRSVTRTGRRKRVFVRCRGGGRVAWKIVSVRPHGRRVGTA